VRTLLKILLLVLLLDNISFPQQTDNKNFIYSTDSIKARININPLMQIQNKFDEFELHREFKEMKLSIPIDGDPQTVWLRTMFAISNSENVNKDLSQHFLYPLERQFLENSKFNLVRYALGMIQVGAVGYLAYKHIKKYGFLK